jgi:hypothetical protein
VEAGDGDGNELVTRKIKYDNDGRDYDHSKVPSRVGTDSVLLPGANLGLLKF